MNHRNGRDSGFSGTGWPRRSSSPFGNANSFKFEAPQAAEWDQLLTNLALTDSEALEAVKTEGEKGERLRNFVLRFFRDHFVPEAAINAVRYPGKVKSVAVPLAGQPTATHLDGVVATFGSGLRGVCE